MYLCTESEWEWMTTHEHECMHVVCMIEIDKTIENDRNEWVIDKDKMNEITCMWCCAICVNCALHTII
jgi:hypothetical protein